MRVAMIYLSQASTTRLATCHKRLRLLIEEVARRIPARLDFSVVCGHRGEREQAEALASGATTKAWPNSLHNRTPSLAVDLAPYPYDAKDEARYAVLAGFVLAVAAELGIGIRWGGDWDNDGRTTDERLRDFPHFELSPDEYESKLAA